MSEGLEERQVLGQPTDWITPAVGKRGFSHDAARVATVPPRVDRLPHTGVRFGERLGCLCCASFAAEDDRLIAAATEIEADRGRTNR